MNKSLKLNPYVEKTGRGPNLVLLHGWGLHGGIWKTLLPFLEPHFRVYNIDLPGFGRSPVHNGAYDLAYLCESIDGVLPDDFYMMGWSMGGLIATELARKTDKKIHKLITVASSPRFIADETWTFGLDKQILESFMGYLSEDYKGTLIRFLAIQTMGSATQKQDVQHLKEMVFLHGMPSEEALSGGLQLLHDSDLLNTITELEIPLLRIYGKLDTMVSVAQANRITELLPDSQSIVFPKAGHAPFLSQPQKVAEAVISFIEN